MSNRTRRQERSSVPTTARRAFSASKQVIEVLTSVAGLVPLPYLKDALEVAQRVLQACEDVTTIEQRVKELQDRICDLLLVILDSLTVHKDSKDRMREAAGNMKEDIEHLKSNLEKIARNLEEIKGQKRWILFVFKDANQSKLDQCFANLTVGLEKFNLSNNLRSSQTLQEIQARLGKMQDVAKGIHEGVEELKTVVARLGQSKVRQAENAFKQRPIPLKPRIFYGRDDMVDEITGWLLVENTDNAPHVCILGPGGMGKTSLALAVANSPLIDAKFHQTCRFWVPCVEATSSNAFLQLLYVSLRTTRDTKDALADILFELSSSDEPRLILLDNFETPWNLADGSQTEINDILSRLANLRHVALIVTMRGTNPPSEDIEWRTTNIPPTDLEASRLIWSKINSKSKDDPQDVDRLIESLGRMPFGVTLMASLGKESRLSASQLLTEWARAGTDMLSDSEVPEKSMNRSIALSVDSPLVRRNADALVLLKTLSLLPAGTTRAQLGWLLPTLKSPSSAIATLSRTALLMSAEEDDQKLFVLPVVQSYMNSRMSDDVRQRARRAFCEYILQHNSRVRDPNFKRDAAALAQEDINIQSALFGWTPAKNEEDLKKIVQALLSFTWFRHDTRPDTKLAVHAVHIARLSGNGFLIADALFALGSIEGRLSQFASALDHLQEARKHFASLERDTTARLREAECALEYVQIQFGTNWDTDEITSLLHTALEVFKELSDGRRYGLCILKIGTANWSNGKFLTALGYLNLAKKVLDEHGNLLDTIDCAEHLADVHTSLGNLREALEERKKAFKILEQVDDPLTSIRIVQGLAETHMLLDHDILAMQYANQALSIRQQHFGRTPSMANTFEIMGQIYIRRGQFKDARGAYETVLNLWSGLDMGDPQRDGRINHCENILQLLAKKEANPDKVVGFRRLSRWAYAPDGLSILLFPRSDEGKIDLEPLTYRRIGS
ncbi:hypothetical protein NLJ89_g2144 [Agrocybe chaxingu]|uniref:Novel STAND NTPase 1 domain-containing protein n=1 Tax=Agrocybe chaxingu TaxID=84603 RepID=A0A9W8MYX9_9AGAR|nr:hypothetical protein NLJ89_g2144 [Agrocybe chaxingu]